MPIDVTEGGRVIELRLKQYRNVLDPMDVTEGEIVMLVRLVHS